MRTPPRRTGLLFAVACATVVTFAVVVLAAMVWQARPTTPETRLAVQLAGERWYAVTFRHTPIGHYQAETGRTFGGNYEFRSVLRFKLADDGETTVEDRLVFDRRPPHRLLRAEQASSGSQAATKRVTIAENAAEIVEGTATRRVAANSDLELRDYLAVEQWLAEGGHGPGDVTAARSVDFDALDISTAQWRFIARRDDWIEVARGTANAAVGSTRAGGRGPEVSDSTRLRLDDDLALVRMESGNNIGLRRVDDEATARLWERGAPLFASVEHRVPVDTPIDEPERLTRLVLEVHREGAAGWPGPDDPAVLTVAADRTRAAAGHDIDEALAATVTYPANDPELRALAKRVTGGLPEARQRADALTLFVHEHLRYRDTTGGRTVFDTVRDRAGDCTEYADLFTTLARSSGLPARTVVGLAYQEDSAAFALHAWNEVVVDGAWSGVDPTWGQARIGATHLPLPDDRALAAIADLPHLRFRVVETDYGS